MASKKKEKFSLSQIKKFPYKTLNRMLNKMRAFLKKDETVQKMFKEYNVSLEEIDYIPMKFDDIDVSAKTEKGIIIFNYRLLCDGDFFEDFSYGAHEITHILQQTCGDKATQSSDDGSYLDNPAEQEAFQNQVSYISDNFGDHKGKEYVKDLLDHHDINDATEKKDKKELFLAKI